MRADVVVVACTAAVEAVAVGNSKLLREGVVHSLPTSCAAAAGQNWGKVPESPMVVAGSHRIPAGHRTHSP